MKIGGHSFAFHGAPAPDRARRLDLQRRGLSWAARRCCRIPRQGEHYEVICSPEDALAMGAGAITMFLIVGTERRRHLREQRAPGGRECPGGPASRDPGDRRIGAVGQPAWKTSGIPSCWHLGPALRPNSARTQSRPPTRAIRYRCARLSRDARFRCSCSVASARPIQRSYLEATRGALDAGAKGVVYGRNVWQADDPVAMCGSCGTSSTSAFAVPA